MPHSHQTFDLCVCRRPHILLHAVVMMLALYLCNISIVTWLIHPLCWLKRRHRDSWCNKPFLAANLTHIRRANSGRLLAATLYGLLTSCSDAHMAASHKAQDPQMCTAHTVAFLSMVWEIASVSDCLGCLHTGLSIMLAWNNKLDIPHPTLCYLHHVVQIFISVCASRPLASTECHFSPVTSLRCPSHQNPVFTPSLHLTSSPPDAFWSFSVWFVLAAAQWAVPAI